MTMGKVWPANSHVAAQGECETVPVTDGRGNVGYGLGGVQEAPRAAPGLGGRKGWGRPLGQERSVKGRPQVRNNWDRSLEAAGN